MIERELYQQELMDHYRHPRNFGTLEQPDASSQVLNPSCGDIVVMQIGVKNDKLTEIRFQGTGCVLSMAAASMLTEFVLGKPLHELETLDKGVMQSLVGLTPGPTRLRCILLPLEALKEALVYYKKGSHA